MLAGSSKRRSSPSSMLKPSCQMCKTRSWGSELLGRDAPRGSGMLRLSTPSPPSVMPVPRNVACLEGPASGVAVSGRVEFLEKSVSRRSKQAAERAGEGWFYALALARISPIIFREPSCLPGSCTASPDFSPPANRFPRPSSSSSSS